MQQEQTEFAVTVSLPLRLLLGGCEGATRADSDSFHTLPIAGRVQQEQTEFAVTVALPSDCLEGEEFAVTVSLPFGLLGECNKSRQNSP